MRLLNTAPSNPVQVQISNLPESYQNYFFWLQTFRTPQTVRAYYYNLMSIERILGKPLIKAKPADLINLKISLEELYDFSSVMVKMQTVKSVIQYFLESKVLTTSPLPPRYYAKRIQKVRKLHLKDFHKPVIRQVLKEEVEHFKTTVSQFENEGFKLIFKTYQKQVAILLLMESGCRLEELKKISIRDIEQNSFADPTGDTKTVYQCRIHNAKLVDGSEDIRVVNISPDTFAVIQEYLLYAPALIKSGDRPLVSVDKRTIQRWVFSMKDGMQKKGYTVDVLTPHDFRRLFLTTLALARENPNVIQRLSGHKNTKSIMPYVLVDERLASVVSGRVFGY